MGKIIDRVRQRQQHVACADELKAKLQQLYEYAKRQRSGDWQYPIAKSQDREAFYAQEKPRSDNTQPTATKVVESSVS